MDISIIIVNYNVKHFLEHCLKSCQRALSNVKGEIIVVDNASTDGSKEMMMSKFPAIAYHYLSDNLGFSKGNNFGIEKAKGRYVLLLNPDTVVEEQTFEKCIERMDADPEIGGLGVYMIDGKGNFLKESKRGLPTPEVAFYKVFGLSALFPRSKKFGRYHLGFLDKNESHEVDVLSGAFMMIRRSVLDKIGLLDETFFMYGEDIDLSYRIQQAGYKNLYFSNTKIIHYKGESTKKSSVNYVMVFYKAMIIFAKKHFTNSGASVFSLLINLAIYIRAALAIGSRLFSKSWMWLLDTIVFFWCFLFTRFWYAGVMNKDFHESFIDLALVAYTVVLSVSMLFSSSYDKPFKTTRLLRGSAIGLVILLAFYSLLPEHYRFSRAVILLGTGASLLAALFLRVLYQLTPFIGFTFTESRPHRSLIIAEPERASAIEGLLNKSFRRFEFLGKVFPKASIRPLPNGYISDITRLEKAISSFKINELIYAADAISFSTILHQMSALAGEDLEFKIAPEGSDFIIGSNSLNRQGELYNALQHGKLMTAEGLRSKRFLDMLSAFLLLLFAPLSIWFVNSKVGFLEHAVQVLLGKKTWVGLDPRGSLEANPVARSGVIHPNVNKIYNTSAVQLIDDANMEYALNYHWLRDFNLIMSNFQHLGGKG